MAYMSQTLKAKLAPKVKEVLKKHNVKGRLSVRNHSTLVLNITMGTIDFIGNYAKYVGDTHHRGYIDVNVYHYNHTFDGQACDFLNEVYTAMMDGNWDNSEPQYDHFDKGWYIDINIGKWDDHYILVK